MNAQDKFTSARIALMFDHPFEGTLLLRLEPKVREDIGTMATDGRNLYWNPAFVDSMTTDETRGVIAHEIWHCLYKHFLRRGARDATLWNIATDYVINGPLVKHGWKLPEGCLDDRKFDGKDAEQVYELLEKEQQDQKNGQGQGQGGSQGDQEGEGDGEGQPGDKDGKAQGQGSGNGKPGKNGKGGESGRPQSGKCIGEVWDSPESQASKSDLDREWREAVIEAARVAKQKGKLPGYAEGFVKDALDPEIPWQDVLKALAKELLNDETSWKVPDNRFVPMGQYLPGLSSEGLGKLYIVVDTSGSCWGTLPKFMGEMEGIVQDCKPSSVVVIECDAKVHKAEEFYPWDELPKKFHGNGGTDFRPAFDWIRENATEPPLGMVFFTDLYGTFPSEDPGYPVIWAATSDIQVPFGSKVLVKE